MDSIICVFTEKESEKLAKFSENKGMIRDVGNCRIFLSALETVQVFLKLEHWISDITELKVSV